jgi:hypothetical protein
MVLLFDTIDTCFATANNFSLCPFISAAFVQLQKMFVRHSIRSVSLANARRFSTTRHDGKLVEVLNQKLKYIKTAGTYKTERIITSAQSSKITVRDATVGANKAKEMEISSFSHCAISFHFVVLSISYRVRMPRSSTFGRYPVVVVT